MADLTADTRELMTPYPVVVQARDALALAARLLSRHGFRHLPVIDLNGHLAGMLYDFDVFRLGALTHSDGTETWLAFDAADATLTAGQVMRPARVVVRADTPLRDTLRQLVRVPDDVAVVVDDAQRVEGLLTEHDGVRFALAVLPSFKPARDVASHPVLTVTRETTAAAAFKLLGGAGVRHLVVVDGDRPVGVVSHRDLVAEDALHHPELRVDGVNAHQRVLTAPDTCTLHEAARTLAQRRIGCLPLVDADGALVGVLTRADVLRATAALLDD